MADNIEKITEYRFTKPNGERVNVEVTYDNDTQYVTHAYSDDAIDNGHISGQWWLDALSLKKRDDLHKNNRALFDFLKTRIGE